MVNTENDLTFDLPKVETTTCRVISIHAWSYNTNKGWINKGFCFCNEATTKVGDTIKVRKNLLQHY